VSSRGELDEILSEDPFYREKVAQYQIMEFSPNEFTAGAKAVFAPDSPI